MAARVCVYTLLMLNALVNTSIAEVKTPNRAIRLFPNPSPTKYCYSPIPFYGLNVQLLISMELHKDWQP